MRRNPPERKHHPMRQFHLLVDEHMLHNLLQVDDDAPSAYDRLTHDRIPSHYPEFLDIYTWGVGGHTLTREQYDAS